MKQLFSFLLVGFVMLMVGCTTNEEPVAKPQLSLTKGEATEVSLTFTVETKAVEKVAYLYTDNIAEAPSATTVLADGVKIEGNKATEVEISNLEAGVTYTIVVAASVSGEVVSQAIEMTTKTKGPEPTPEPEYLYDEELFYAKRYTSEELGESLPDNHFFMTMSDDAQEPNYILALVLVGAEEDKVLQAGTYTIANGGIRYEESGLLVFDTQTEYTFDAECEGSVVVEGDVDGYTFDITLQESNGKFIHFTYKGVVEGMVLPEPAPEDVELTTAKSTWKGQYHTVEFANADESVKLSADIYTYNYKFGYLSDGLYTVKNSGYSFTAGEIDYYYSSFTADGKKANLDSGTIEVTINDDLSYNIIIDIIDANGREFKNQYVGKIEGMSFEDGFE